LPFESFQFANQQVAFAQFLSRYATCLISGNAANHQFLVAVFEVLREFLDYFVLPHGFEPQAREPFPDI
jgi:hypothetical protein